LTSLANRTLLPW